MSSISKKCRYSLPKVLFIVAIIVMSCPMEVVALKIQGEIVGSYQGTITSNAIGTKDISGNVEGSWTVDIAPDGSFTARASGTMGGDSFSGFWQADVVPAGTNNLALVGTWILPGTKKPTANKFQWTLDSKLNAFVGETQGVIPNASGGGTIKVTTQVHFPQFPQGLASHKGNLSGSWTANISGSITGTAVVIGRSINLGSTPFNFSMDGNWSGSWAVKDTVLTGNASGSFEGSKTEVFTLAGISQSVPITVKGEWLGLFNINSQTGQLSFSGSWVEFGHEGVGQFGSTFGGSIALNISPTGSFPLPVSGTALGGGNFPLNLSGTQGGFPFTANIMVNYAVSVKFSGNVSLPQ